MARYILICVDGRTLCQYCTYRMIPKHNVSTNKTISVAIESGNEEECFRVQRLREYTLISSKHRLESYQGC